MIKRLFFSLMILMFILAACSPAQTPYSPASDMQGESAGAPPAFESEPMRDATTTNNLPDVSLQNQPDRLVIKNANMSIVVPDPTASLALVSAMANEMGGYVVSSNLYKTTSSNGVQLPEANITIRVPADQLDSALGRIKALVEDPDNDILTENVTGQDVTKEYTNLQSRLTNLENTEKQLQEIMDEATKTEDVLAVYNQLVSVREQIEVLTGEIKYYEESAALSMIALTLVSQESVEPLSIGGWQPAGVARDALQATLEALKFLVNAGIYIVLFILPIGLLIFLPIWLVWKLLRRGRKNKNSALPPVPPEQPANPV